MISSIIPIEHYTPIYHHILLMVTILTFIHTLALNYNDPQNVNFTKTSGVMLFIFVLFYLGLRPIHQVFGDMPIYTHTFLEYKSGVALWSSKDMMFQNFMYSSAKIMTPNSFFFLCATLYVIPAYVISKKWFNKGWFYSFLLIVGSFSFWSYGTNGIRNGLGTSMFLIALAFDKRYIKVIFLALAIGFHKSMALPVLGYVITWFYNNPKPFFYFWLASIPLSLALPGFWESLFASMVEDDRASYLTTEASADDFSSVGFRWDFLIYSATGVFAGWWYIFKEKLEDKKYIQLFNTYLFANSFWILVIRANFSNRFAYLSWFLLALVIVYPWIRYRFTGEQHKKLGWIMMAYIGFTYIMAIIL